MIVETSGWRHLKEKNKLFLSCEYKKKAGYTATSCGRVGRGRNAHFPTFQLERDGPTDRRTCPQLKSIIPALKSLNFLKLPQIKNRKLYFSLTFQKVELRDSTFFQLYSCWLCQSCQARVFHSSQCNMQIPPL